MQKIGNIPNTRADNNGEFTDGNVAGGVPPTILPAEWFNTIQRELISVLSAAGITPDSNKFDQVSKAVSKLITDGGFLKTVNNLSEIKTAGAAAVAAALENLGLSDVAHIPFVQTMGARMATYLTAGTFTFTVPDGVTRIRARVVGGGGGAGGSAAVKSGGGGGAGGYSEDWITVTPGQVLTITVGANGAGGTAGNAGASGGSSSISGYLSASGGAYGDAGGGGTGAGGFGGAGTGGSINTVGSDGTDGATTATVGSGIGGGSILGGSTRSGGTGRNSLSIGGGGAASYTLASQNGGNGHAGAVILEY
ncbi:bacteriophage tail fiber protein [Yersinia frederiksenii]|nr:bacteriophage tail fiber protein [Yersinia frederiksenii]